MKLRFSILFAVLAALFTSNVALAQQFTLLPTASKDIDCDVLLNSFELDGIVPAKEVLEIAKVVKASGDYNAVVLATGPDVTGEKKGDKIGRVEDYCKDVPDDEVCQQVAAASAQKAKALGEDVVGSGRDNLLGCAIKTGRISLQMIPYFISYISNFLLSIIGLICVLFIVLGGYFYIAAGLTEGKEKGKKYISHALLGMAVAILSWIIVNVVMYAVTS
jgi:hypothetical protein